MIKTDQPTIFDKSKITALLSSKSDGNTRPEWGLQADVERTASALAKQMDVSTDNIVVMNVGGNQDAWDEIEDVTSAKGRGLFDPEERIVADALVTNVPGAVLMLPVADCNAVAIHDPVQNVLALVHLGWQSTVAELATKAVEHLQQKYRSSATNLRIYFSPAIKAESYVFDDVSQAKDPMWKDYLRKTEKGVGVDLSGFNRARFIEAGVPAENIEVCPVNTATSDEYYSHYRSVRSGEAEGRFSLLVSLRR
jgi:copper oxidase (laccase) domain-containing protein